MTYPVLCNSLIGTYFAWVGDGSVQGRILGRKAFYTYDYRLMMEWTLAAFLVGGVVVSYWCKFMHFMIDSRRSRVRKWFLSNFIAKLFFCRQEREGLMVEYSYNCWPLDQT